MIVVDMQGVERFARKLERFAAKGVPHAARNAMNTAAFEGRRVWNETIQREMVLRNSWTTRSTKVVKASGTKVQTMESVVGTPLAYMETQEEGGTIGKHGKYGHAIPTTSAAGQAMKAPLRTKQLQRKNYLSAIHLAGRVTGPRYRRNAAAIAIAVRNGSKVAFLDTGRRKGIFRVMGGKRLSVRMLWDLSHESVRIKKKPTLQHALTRLEPQLPYIYTAAIIEQLKRHGAKGLSI